MDDNKEYKVKMINFNKKLPFKTNSVDEARIEMKLEFLENPKDLALIMVPLSMKQMPSWTPPPVTLIATQPLEQTFPSSAKLSVHTLSNK